MYVTSTLYQVKLPTILRPNIQKKLFNYGTQYVLCPHVGGRKYFIIESLYIWYPLWTYEQFQHLVELIPRCSTDLQFHLSVVMDAYCTFKRFMQNQSVL